METRLLYKISVIPSVFLLFAGCSQPQQIAARRTPFQVEMPDYTRHLKGFKICLDPGHGGQGQIPGYKRGPTGVREADINLKVALHLRDMLQEVGAIVIMTRVDDSYVSLATRSQIANNKGADFFISLHHNGTDNPKTNYTSTWYHGDADDSRQSLDLARYIQQGVSDALRLPSSPATGLYSDKLITASGFGVLRLTKCPAVLGEASFLSNPEEEERLKEDDYLKKEAYGYFLGIARYVEAGFPKGILVKPQPASIIQTKTPLIEIQVEDGLHERGAWMLERQQIFTDTIRVKIDNESVPYHYARDADRITVAIEKPLSNGVHFVETALVNYYGNHSLPSPQWFKVAPPAAALSLSAWTDTLPADGQSYVGISVTARDAEGMPIADDEPIYAKTSNGRLAETRQSSKHGTSQFYLYAPDTPGTATVEIAYRETRETLTIHFADIERAIVQGQVSDADTGKPLQGVTVQLASTDRHPAVTDAEGHFFLTTEREENTTLHISKTGYYPDKRQINMKPNQATVAHATLHPIADGAFASTVIILDSQSDTPATTHLIETLEAMLKLAGAEIHNLYTPGQKLPIEKRIETINTIAESGYYLQINHAPQRGNEPAVVASHYRGNQVTETFLKQILAQFNQTLFETPIVTVQDKITPEIQQTNKMAMILDIRSLNQPNAAASAIFFGAWNFLKADAALDSEKQKRFMAYFKEMRDKVHLK